MVRNTRTFSFIIINMVQTARYTMGWVLIECVPVSKALSRADTLEVSYLSLIQYCGGLWNPSKLFNERLSTKSSTFST